MPTGCLQADGARGFIKKSPINWLLVNNLETHTTNTHTQQQREAAFLFHDSIAFFVYDITSYPEGRQQVGLLC